MSDGFRAWLSDVSPDKPDIFRGVIARGDRSTSVAFNAQTLELHLDGRRVGFPAAPPEPKRLGLLVSRDSLREQMSRFFVHVNNYCNLRCTYCYEQDLPYDSIRERTMPDAKTTEVCRFIRAVSSGSSRVHITFFGGEPFLSFNKVVQFHRTLTETLGDTPFSSNIVTNGTILTDRQLEFLIAHDFEVMVSFDGTRAYQDAQRPGPEGTSNYDLVVGNIDRLVKAGLEKVSIRMTYGQGSLDLLGSVKAVAALKPHDLAFRPIMDATPVDRWESPAAHAESLHRVVDYYLSRLLSDEPLVITNVHEVLRRILFQSPKTDYCDWGRICSITPDGDVFPCTHFVGMPEFKLGTTKDSDIDRDRQAEFRKATEIPSLPCATCSVRHVCGGGCRGCSQHVHHDIFREDDYCEARREIVHALMNGVVDLWQAGRWPEAEGAIQKLTEGGQRKHSCDRFS